MVIRLLWLIMAIGCGLLAYASMHNPVLSEDGNLAGIVGALGAMWGIWKVIEPTETHNHNHS